MSLSTARWGTVATIFRREVRDQVRDRRTLFMVFVLPLLLYPILGIGVLQLATSFEQKARVVVVVGAEHLPPAPPLLNPARDGFNPALFGRPEDTARLHVRVEGADSPWLKPGAIREAIRGGLADAVVTVPPDIRDRVAGGGATSLPIQYDSTDEPSQMTYLRVREVVERWRDGIVQDRLAKDGKPADYTEPVVTVGADVAPEGEAGGSIWGRLFPFLLVIMALTGAFYPAVDLCAGEKERGTMETLLLSPASRTEVVLGKFLTVMLASITTALLNLVSMGLTGVQIAAQLASVAPGRAGAKMVAVMAPPQPSSYVWMMLLLIPLAAFFSALCVALATLARSMKEGQYYMTPLYLVSLPLILVTLAPEVKLDRFFALVPITGPSLLLKTLILGEYGTARRFFVPVLVQTLIYAALALRWAVDLFQREDVIFRESEVFDLRIWARQLVRDKEPTPSAGGAIFCFAAMISLAWFVAQATAGTMSPLMGMLLGHLLFIFGPPVALALFLTSDPARTLRLRAPRAVDLVLAAGLALALNPAVRELAVWTGHLFPASESIQRSLAEMAKQIPNLGVGVLVLAFVPAITEEFAFRGTILSGLARTYRPWTAIILSALLFAFLHVLLSLFQQFFGAALLGVVLGAIAWRTGSLWPGVVFHFVNNALGVLTVDVARHPRVEPYARWLLRESTEGLYHVPIVIAGAGLGAVLFAAIWRGNAPGRPAASEPDPILADPVVA